MHHRVAMDWPAARVVTLVVCSLIVFARSNVAFCVAPPIGQTEGDSVAFDRNAPLPWPGSKLIQLELNSLLQGSNRPQILESIQDQLYRLDSPPDDYLQRAESLAEILSSLDKANQQLQSTAREKWSSADAVHEKEYAQKLARFYFNLQRRLSIWQTILKADQNEFTNRSNKSFQLAGRSTLSIDNVSEEWKRYLKLPEADQVLNSLNAPAETKRVVARDTLARLVSPVLNPAQTDYLAKRLDIHTIRLLLRHAGESTNYEKMMSDLERFEGRPTAYLASVVNNHYQNLLWSPSTVENEVAVELEKFYRRPNLHFTVSRQLINRMVPAMPTTRETVNDSILGSQVTADNHIESRVEVNLIPDPSQIHFNLATLGNIRSVSVAERQGFQIHTEGVSQFRVQNELILGKTGFNSKMPVATCNSDQNLVGLESRFDNLPLFGSVVRRLALRKIRSETPKVKKIAERKVADLAKRRVETELQSHLEQATSKFEESVYQRLVGMDLDPVATQYSTTSNHIVMQHRLAGRDQLGAHTIRPDESPGCQLGLQIHQSAINNLIGRLGLNGGQFDTEQLVKHLQQTLDISTTQSQSLAEKKAEFHFARHDPFLVEFKDDQIHVSMNLTSLRIGSGPRWRRVTLAAVYQPSISGNTVKLTQDDTGTLIRGYRLNFRDRAAVGTIHKALFKRTMEFELVPEKYTQFWRGLQIEVDRLEMQDGWAAISFSDQVDIARNPMPLK